MINESQTKQLLKLLNPTQKKELAAYLNEISSQNSYSEKTINRYIKTRIPSKLLQPIKRWLLNSKLSVD
jgi:hypothetical protein